MAEAREIGREKGNEYPNLFLLFLAKLLMVPPWGLTQVRARVMQPRDVSLPGQGARQKTDLRR